MTVSTETIRRLAALDLSAEAFKEVLSILADSHASQDVRREKDRERKRLSKESARNVRGNSTGNPSPSLSPPSPPRDINSTPPSTPIITPSLVASRKKLPDPDPDADLFRRGKEILGPSAGGQIRKLKGLFGGDVEKTRAMIEAASAKQCPAEYVAATIKRNSGQPFHFENGYYDKAL